MVDIKMNVHSLFWKLLNIFSTMYCVILNCLDSPFCEPLPVPLFDDIVSIVNAQIINLSEVLSVFTGFYREHTKLL